MTLKQLAAAIPRRAVMTALLPAEKWLCRRAGTWHQPAIFVVGPPRSGTTLLYDLLIHCYRFSYISNLAHRLYLTPVAATRLAKQAILRYRGRFESTFGHISGWAAPNEGGWVWNRWFPQNYYLDAEYARGLPVQEIRTTIAGMSMVLEAPFLNKNVMHSVHMRLLDYLFPNCLFIHIAREISANVRSIVRMRRQRLGEENERKWLSVLPPGAESRQHEETVVQVAAQVQLTHETILRDGAYLGGERVFSLTYEDLCERPRAMVHQIAAFVSGHGVELNQRLEPPESFPHADSWRLDDVTEEMISRSVGGRCEDQAVGVLT